MRPAASWHPGSSTLRANPASRCSSTATARATSDGYFDRLEDKGISINLGTLVPATLARREVVGLDNRSATADEMRRMEAFVDRGMRAGGLGLSTALIYP